MISDITNDRTKIIKIEYRFQTFFRKTVEILNTTNIAVNKIGAKSIKLNFVILIGFFSIWLKIKIIEAKINEMSNVNRLTPILGRSGHRIME